MKKLWYTPTLLAGFLGVVACSMSLLFAMSLAQASLPDYPNESYDSTRRCDPVSPACLVCPGDASGYGCDSGVPTGWGSGLCNPTNDPTNGCVESSFNQCGDQIDCVFDFYTGRGCSYTAICRNR